MSDTEQSAGVTELPRPWRVILGMWVLAILVIAGGVWLSWLNVLDRYWLARSGSVVVALGIWSGLSIIFGEQVYARAYALRRRLLVARARMRYRHDPKKQEEEIRALETWLEERLERHRGQHRLSVGILEATLLIVGTLVWGFGDLIYYVF